MIRMPQTPAGTSGPNPKSLHKAAWTSFGVSFILLGLKVTGYLATGSSAVLSDALESIINVVTAGVAVAVIRFALQPADEDHPYGHGKAEYVSAAFEGGLIVFAAIAILLESIRGLVQGVELRQLDLGFALVLTAAFGNWLLALHLRRVGRREKSETLTASSAHIMSDVKTTVGVGIGLLLVKFTGMTWIDPLAAMVVAILLGIEGWHIVRRSFAGLVDELDEESLKFLPEAILRHRRPGIIEIHLLKAIRSGNFHHIDAHLVVPEYWDVLKAHALTHEFEEKVVADYPYDGEFAFHLDPCRQKFCAVCDLSDCPIRLKSFVRLPRFDVKSLIGNATGEVPTYA
jgi:cation diffusion facilitator family transporter